MLCDTDSLIEAMCSAASGVLSRLRLVVLWLNAASDSRLPPREYADLCGFHTKIMLSIIIEDSCICERPNLERGTVTSACTRETRMDLSLVSYSCAVVLLRVHVGHHLVRQLDQWTVSINNTSHDLALICRI